MIRCTKCVMTDTWVGNTFDENGVCSVCRQVEEKPNLDWARRQKIFQRILKKYRKYADKKGNKYNCIVGYSGGKDTAYTLWAMVKKYNMTPLVVTFDHGFSLSPEGEWNLQEIPKILNCDHLRFTLGNGLRNSLCLKASEINGDFCWHCHNGVGTFPARISKQWDIPLQIWGEPNTEYQTGFYTHDDMEEQDKEHYEKVFQVGVTPEMVLPENYKITDLLPLLWPKGKLKLKAAYLGNFEPWNQREHVDIITRELGWKHHKVEGTYVDWDKVDCPYEPIRDWQKFMKRGFGRTTFQASKDIREGLLSRDDAIKLVEELEGHRPACMDTFLADVGMTEEQFNEITLRHKVQ